MRDSIKQAESSTTRSERISESVELKELSRMPFEAKEFFESVYRSSVRGDPDERATIGGGVSEMEAAFHYNSVANSIIRALGRRSPPPAPAMLEAWRMLQQRRNCRLLDVGSGTGYWIDFIRKIFFVDEVVGVEITEGMVEFLRQKYAGDCNTTILCGDITSPDFSVDTIGGPVDYVTAIGVMFHIVDDDLWRRAVANLAGVLKPEGLLLIGGDFRTETRDVQFHRTDHFDSWKEHDQAEVQGKQLRVNKRVRSLADWHRVISANGLLIADLVRSDNEPSFLTTPENDLLVLQRPGY